MLDIFLGISQNTSCFFFLYARNVLFTVRMSNESKFSFQYDDLSNLDFEFYQMIKKKEKKKTKRRMNVYHTSQILLKSILFHLPQNLECDHNE